MTFSEVMALGVVVNVLVALPYHYFVERHMSAKTDPTGELRHAEAVILFSVIACLVPWMYSGLLAGSHVFVWVRNALREARR